MESSRKIIRGYCRRRHHGRRCHRLGATWPGRLRWAHGHDARRRCRGVKFDPAARAEQRLTQFKADLKLTAAQEPLWQAFAEKAKSEAGKGIQAMRDQAQDLSLSAPERMSRRTEVMKQRVAAMESVNASFKTLYDALTVEQRRAADIHASRMGDRGHYGAQGSRRPDGTRWRHAPQGMAPPIKG